MKKMESQKLKIFQKLQPILDKQELSVQSAADRTKAVQVWNWGITYSPKPGNWPLQYMKTIQGNCGGSMLERISLKKYIYLKVGKLGSYMTQ